jgi:hypothetical protein
MRRIRFDLFKVLVICSVVAICFALFQEVVAWQRILTSADTTGEVTRIVLDGGPSEDGVSDYTTFISFDANNGQSYEFRTSYSGSDSRYTVGQLVSVVYTIDNHQDASVGFKEMLWAPPLLVLGVLIWIPFCLVRKKS